MVIMSEQKLNNQIGAGVGEKKSIEPHRPLPNPPPPKKVLFFVATLMVIVGLLCFLVSGI
jgi:hypothetical protein